MTLPSREEAEALVASMMPADAPMPAEWRLTREHMLPLLALARIGLSVAYPSDETVGRLELAIIAAWAARNRQMRRIGAGAAGNDLALGSEATCAARAVLSALTRSDA